MQILVKTVRELPNGAILLEKRLYFLIDFGKLIFREAKSLFPEINNEHDIAEIRKKINWIKDSKGRFAGSFPMGGSGGNSGLTNGGGSDIMNSGSDDVTISSSDSPIEQKHTGKGNPNAILIFDDISLNNRQQALLNILPDYDSRATVHRDSVNMPDLSALTAKTGDEFAMFTKGNERLIVRGNATKVNIGIKEAEKLSTQGYKWSGHTHPGTDINVLMPSSGDKEILRCFQQEISVIYNSKGEFATFGKE